MGIIYIADILLSNLSLLLHFCSNYSRCSMQIVINHINKVSLFWACEPFTNHINLCTKKWYNNTPINICVATDIYTTILDCTEHAYIIFHLKHFAQSHLHAYHAQ